MPEKNITVYSTTTCPYCHMAMDYLKSKGVKYTEVNVEENPERVEEMVEKSGQMGVPVLDVKGVIIVGFNKKAIDAALAKK